MMLTIAGPSILASDFWSGISHTGQVGDGCSLHRVIVMLNCSNLARSARWFWHWRSVRRHRFHFRSREPRRGAATIRRAR